MRNFKMVLCYDGSRYDGWQKQGNTQNTIQGKLESLFSQMTGKTVEVQGAGRTDAGVHARGQVANVKLESCRNVEEIFSYVNQYLPEDIGVLSLEEVDMRFHARLLAKRKCYCYYIQTGLISDPFLRRYSLRHVEPLSIEKMKEAADFFIGTYDFTSFCKNHQKKKSAVRTIEALTVTQTKNQIKICVRGDGFLYNMVRIIVGTLIEVGEGKKDAEKIPVILSAKDRKKAGPTAPAQGLFLEKVFYQ